MTERSSRYSGTRRRGAAGTPLFILFCTVMMLLVMAAQPHTPARAQAVYDEPAWVYKERGDRLRAQGRPGEALAAYRKALVRRSREEGPSAYPEVHLELAGIYREQGLHELALEHIQKAYNQREFLAIPDWKYRIWYTEAEIYRNLDRTDLVKKVYKRIVQDDNEKNFFLNRPLSRLPEGYIREFRENRELRAKFAPAWYQLGSIEYQNGNYEGAEPDLRMAFLYGYNARTIEYLLDCYRMSGNRAEYELVLRFARRQP